jgi:hypothetical protein
MRDPIHDPVEIGLLAAFVIGLAIVALAASLA